MTSKDDLDQSNALVGQGNVAQQRGDIHGAIKLYKQALDHYPGHTYAWHDIFIACCELARQGEPNLELMRVSLEAVKKLEETNPLLGAKQVALLQEQLDYYEAVNR